MIPRPPCCAMAMARPDSVTVSMAALSSGTFRRMRSRQPGADVHRGRQHLRVARHQQDVVEREGGRQFGADLQHGRCRGLQFHRACPSFAPCENRRRTVCTAPSHVPLTFALRDRRGRPSLPGAVALLVLLAAAARARVVPAHLRLVAPHGLHHVVAAGALRLPGRARRAVEHGGRVARSAAQRDRAAARLAGRRAGAPPRPRRPGAATTCSAPSPRPRDPSCPGTARSSPSCTRRAGRAGRSRAGRCLP